MAGIYIHIPFCKQRCTYCDFYTQVAPQKIPEIVTSIVAELHLRKDYLKNQQVDTIYFGGGTPSLLNYIQFKSIFSAIFDTYNVDKNAEITFEANPDDLSLAFLNDVMKLPFNRISIGIQSFDDEFLKRINRRHSGIQAIKAVQACKQHGINNISIDLIYGLPGQTMENWSKELETAYGLDVQHISVYGLTYEQGTRLWKQREMGTVQVVDEDVMIEMYDLMLQKMDERGFEAYEISNFALPGCRSRHNSAYWKMNPYLGVGPSAHSFDGNSRQWNIASNTKYINAIKNGMVPFEKEVLSMNDRYNDYVMVSLRTADGIDIDFIEKQFGVDFSEYCMLNSTPYINSKKMIQSNNILKLSNEGIQISNLIISELMKV
ncbi:MAG: radical SAM family heme chaperone HemW [Paludibacter sp.]|nr:radical SAM family heme chaperone HemW [Paludibacter sp.]